MNERRLEGRFLCADLVKIGWRAETTDAFRGDALSTDDFETVEAVLEDISALGACVQVEQGIPSGVAISITVNTRAEGAESQETARFSGHVSYCVYRDYGYFVGIVFSGETRWSSGVFEPQHLTSLEALLPSARN